MTTTGLIIGESPKRLAQIHKVIEGTGLFDAIETSSDFDPALVQTPQDDPDVIFYAPGQLSPRRADVLRRMVDSAAPHDIPVLLFAETASERQRLLGFECGASDLLAHNTPPLEIAARARRILEQKRRLEALRRANAELARQTITDTLSGLSNRRYFDQVLESEAARSSRSGETFTLMLLDLDHFKKINDILGHPAGDAVIRAVGNILKSSLRSSDTACRYGGEEFALIMPETKETAAALVAERLRRNIAALAIPEIPEGYPVTVSIGLACASGPGRVAPAQLLSQADKALYAAKSAGRNRIVSYNQGAPNAPIGPKRSAGRFLPPEFFALHLPTPWGQPT